MTTPERELQRSSRIGAREPRREARRLLMGRGAFGARHREMPLRPERVWQAIRRAQAG